MEQCVSKKNDSTPSSSRRRIAGAAFLDLAISTLFIWNVFVRPLTDNLGVSLTQANYVFSLGLAMFSLGVIVGGPLADKFAPRHLAIISGIAMVLGLSLAAASPSFVWAVFGFGVLQGGAAGLGYATAVHEAGLINHGFALALVVSAYGAGSAVLAWPIARLLQAFPYSIAFIVLAIFCSLACGTAAILLSNRAPQNAIRASRRYRPLTHQPDRRFLGLLWLTFGFGSTPGLMGFALAGAFAGGIAPDGVIAVNLGNLGGRLLAGALADRLGTSRTLHGSCLLIIVGSLLLASTSSRDMLVAGLFITGLQYGALSTLLPLIVRTGVPVAIYGRCFGTVFSAWGLFGLAAPIVGAMLIELGGANSAAKAMLVCALLSWFALFAALQRLPSPPAKYQ